MITLDEYNKEQSKKYEGLQSGPNDIQCSICGEEMNDGDPRYIIGTFPPKRKIYCKHCGHEDFKVL